MRILHFLPSLAEGGAPLGALELARRQAENGDDIRMVVLDRSGCSPPKGFESVPIDFLDLHYQFADREAMRGCVQQFLNHLVEHTPEIVHAHLWPATLVAARARTQGAPGKVISHIRDTPAWIGSRSPRNFFKRYWFRRAMHAADVRFLAVSSEANTYTRRGLGLSSNRIVTVLNAIDGRRFAKAPIEERRPPFAVAIIGRLAPEKGQLDFLTATRGVIRRRELAITIVGTGSEYQRLKEFVRTNSLEDGVEFVDSVEDMGTFLAKQDLVAVPSRGAEGLPRVVMEAMWCGVPVIASSTSGVADAIEPGISGVIVKQGDESAWAREVEQMIDQPQTRAAIGTRARSRARELFSLDRMVKEVNRQYQLALG